MIPANSPLAPKYWMHETSGKLERVVKKYLAGHALNAAEFGLMIAYLRQWANSPAWDQNPHAEAEERLILAALRSRVGDLRTPKDLHAWISDAAEFGMDPL